MACQSGEPEIKKVDTRINFNLLPGEELLTCPYNKSHAVLPIKYANHVNRCHVAHVKEQQRKGLKSRFAICRYDTSHHEDIATIAFHEANCRSRISTGDDEWGEPTGCNAGSGANLKDSAGTGADPKDNAATGTNLKDSAGSGSNGNAAAGSLNTAGIGGEGTKNEWVVVGASGRGRGRGIAGKTRNPVKPKVYPEPPPIDPNTLTEMFAENWDQDPGYQLRFNPNQRVHELRSNHYSYIRTADVMGKTPSEKREFYAKERETLKTYERQGVVDRLKREQPQGQKTSSSISSNWISSSTTLSGSRSMYGEDPGIYSIEEQDAE